MTHFVVTSLPEIEITRDVWLCIPEGCYGTITPSTARKVRREREQAPEDTQQPSDEHSVDSSALRTLLNLTSESGLRLSHPCLGLFNGANI